jgi:hypothetical protein
LATQVEQHLSLRSRSEVCKQKLVQIQMPTTYLERAAMKFITRSGSLYQIDVANKKIRRLEGKANATPHQGADGEWKSYEAIGSPTEMLSSAPAEEDKVKLAIGEGALIVWVQSEHAALSSMGGTKTTLTSDVVEIIKEEKE